MVFVCVCVCVYASLSSFMQQHNGHYVVHLQYESTNYRIICTCCHHNRVYPLHKMRALVDKCDWVDGLSTCGILILWQALWLMHSTPISRDHPDAHIWVNICRCTLLQHARLVSSLIGCRHAICGIHPNSNSVANEFKRFTRCGMWDVGCGMCDAIRRCNSLSAFAI